jgi:hypothetical protein
MPSKGISGRRDRRLREQIHKPYAAVHKVPKPVKLPSGPKQKMTRDHNNDLRAIFSDTGKKAKRWFRENELLWCELDSPISGRHGTAASIAFWPCLVQEVILKIIPISKASSGGTDTQSAMPTDDVPDSMPTSDSVSPHTPNVDQSFVYKVKFLVLEHTAILPAERLLPYQGYSMSSELFNIIQEFPLDEVDISPEVVSSFDVQRVSTDTDDGYKRFEEAVAPYTLAIQIASSVAGYWCPTDEWEFKFSIPPTTLATSKQEANSLSNAIVSAGQKNASLMTKKNS